MQQSQDRGQVCRESEHLRPPPSTHHLCPTAQASSVCHHRSTQKPDGVGHCGPVTSVTSVSGWQKLDLNRSSGWACCTLVEAAIPGSCTLYSSCSSSWPLWFLSLGNCVLHRAWQAPLVAQICSLTSLCIMEGVVVLVNLLLP